MWCLLLSCLSSPVVLSWLVLLIGWLALSSYAFGNQSSCAGPPGLRAPLDALREAWPQRPAIALWLHAQAHRNVAFHHVSYNTVHQTPRVGKVWAVVALSWKSWRHWAGRFMLPAAWFRGLPVCSGCAQATFAKHRILLAMTLCCASRACNGFCKQV